MMDNLLTYHLPKRLMHNIRLNRSIVEHGHDGLYITANSIESRVIEI